MEKKLKTLKTCYKALMIITAACYHGFILVSCILGDDFWDSLQVFIAMSIYGLLIMGPCYFCESNAYETIKKTVLSEHKGAIKIVRIIMCIIDIAVVLLYAVTYVLFILSTVIEFGGDFILDMMGITIAVGFIVIVPLIVVEFFLSRKENKRKTLKDVKEGTLIEEDELQDDL